MLGPCRWDAFEEMCESLNNVDVFWMNQVQMMPNVVGRWRVGGKLRLLSDLWCMPGVCDMGVRVCCMMHCVCLFCFMVVKE